MVSRLSVVFLFASIGTLIFVFSRIRKNGLSIDDALIWILWAILLIILSLVPQLTYFIAKKIGFLAPSNFVFTMFIFFLFIICFIQTIEISKLKVKQNDLIQKISIKDYEDYLLKKEKEKEKK